MSSSVAICAICLQDARPIFEDLQSISACGHVFHEACLQQWMESCPAGRDPTCPLCKRSISCPARDVHRLYFQSAGSDSTEPQVSPSRNLQTAVEDPKHVAVNLQRAEESEVAIVFERSELARIGQDLTSVRKGLMCLSLELEEMQEEIGATEKRVEKRVEKVRASHEQARRVIRILEGKMV